MSESGKESELNHLVSDIVEDSELVEYFFNSNSTAVLVKWVHEETGIDRKYLTPAFKLLSFCLRKAFKSSAKFTGGVLAQKAQALLLMIPHYNDFINGIKLVKEKLVKNVNDRQLIEDVVRGKRPVESIEDLQKVPLDLAGTISMLNGITEIRSDLAHILERLNPQPPLYLKIQELKRATRLSYRARRVSMTGREEELSRLKAFLDSDRDFSWWAVSGKAGVGKSRLALELALSRGQIWRCGLLSRSDFSWSQWLPDQPTLIIVDYAAGRKELATILDALTRRSGQFAEPVRLLLLERTASGEWWDRFIGVGSDKHDRLEKQNEEPMSLFSLEEGQAWRIVEDIVKHECKPVPPRDATLEAIKRIDPDLRPLFLTIMADALCDGKDVKDWDKTDLLKDLLKRELEAYWKPKGFDESHANMLCLATMAGGLTPAQLSVAVNDVPLPTRINRELCDYIMGYDCEGSCPPLEPDLFGEFYVLSHLATSIHDKSLMSQFSSAAWRLGSLEFALFLVRAAQDFPNHSVLPELMKRIPTELGAILAWAAMIWDLTVLTTVGGFPLLSTLSEELLNLSKQDDSYGEIRRVAAVVLFNLLTDLGESGELDAARSLHDKLKALARSYPDEPEVRLQQAEGSFNLINYLGESGNFDDARSLYYELKALARSYPDEPEVRLQQAKGAFNLLSDFGKSGDLDAARSLFDELKALAGSYPGEPEVRLQQAEGAFNLLTDLGGTGDLDGARWLYDELEALAGSYPGEPEVRLQQAEGAFNLITYLGESGDLDAARSLYDELKALAGSYPDESDVRLQQAKGASNLITYLGKSGDLDAARSLYSELETLAGSYPDEPEVRLQQAESAVDLMAYLGKSGDLDAAKSMHDKLTALIASYPDESDLRNVLKQSTKLSSQIE